MKKSMKRLLALTLALMLAVVAPFSAAPEVSAASYRGTVTLYGTPEAAIKNGPVYGSKVTIDLGVREGQSWNNESFRIPQVSEYFELNDGWTIDYVYVSGNSAGKRQPGGSFLLSMSGGSMVYYFKQTGVSRTYSLSYNANGGAGAPATQSAGSTASSYSFQVSSTVPTRDGHTFLGWADSATASSAQYHAGDSVTLSSSSPSKTLYAVWSKNPDPLYTLTVATSPVGGTTSGGGSYAQGANVSISATAPTAPEGKVYVFDEWTSNAGGSFGNPALAGTSFVMPASNVTVTARYLLKDDANHNGKPDDEEDKFDIRYTTVEAAGVSGMPADVTDVLPGTQQTVSSASPVRDGYVFAGWTIGDVSVTDGVFTMPEKDVTFSAVWKEDANHNGKPDDEEDKFDIRYTTVEAEGVSGMPADVTDVLPGKQQTVSSASPVRDGYVFAGWTTGDVSVTDGVFTMPEKDVTFSAVWKEDANHNGKPDDEEDKFDIRYTTVDAAGVSGMPADVTDVLPGTQQTVSSASPVRDGYVFAGWTTGDVSVTDGVFTMPEKDVTFSAVWQQEENPSSSESSSSESSSGDGSDVSSEEPSSNPDVESEDESEPIIDVPDVSTPLAGPSEGDGTAEGGSAPEEGGASSGSGQPNTGNSSRAIPLFFGMMAASIAIAFAALLALKRKTN